MDKITTSNNQQQTLSPKRRPNRNRRNKKQKLTIMPVGGCGEFGMNMTCYTVGSHSIIVDAGIIFSDPQMLGVSSIIPNIRMVEPKIGQIAAYVITHGHEDHIGALPYLMKDRPAPIYASPWTSELIRRKLTKARLDTRNIITVGVDDQVKIGPFDIQFVPVNHSIPDACSLVIRAAKKTIFHTGDFKIDLHPIEGRVFNMKQLAKQLPQGVDLLVADSTNAHCEGMSPSESVVVKSLEKIIKKANGRVFITTFSSHFWRLAEIGRICKDLGKKLVIAGRGIQECFDVGLTLKYVQAHDLPLITEDQCNKYPPEKLVFLVSGCQGEQRSAMRRISLDEHRSISLQAKDTIILSSRTIPGNEKSVIMMMDSFHKKGVSIINDKVEKNVHVSGHAYSGDIKALMKAVKPKFFLPVHGTYWHMMQNGQLKQEEEAVRVLDNGCTVSMDESGIAVRPPVSLERLYVDSDTYTTLDHQTLRDRLRIGELGMVTVSGVYSKESGDWLRGLRLKLVGLCLDRDRVAEDGEMNRLKNQLASQIEEWLSDDKGLLEKKIVNWMKKRFQRRLGKEPVIVVQVFVL